MNAKTQNMKTLKDMHQRFAGDRDLSCLVESEKNITQRVGDVKEIFSY